MENNLKPNDYTYKECKNHMLGLPSYVLLQLIAEIMYERDQEVPLTVLETYFDPKQFEEISDAT